MEKVSLTPTKAVIHWPNTAEAPVAPRILLRATAAGHMKRIVIGKCSRKVLVERILSPLAAREGQNNRSRGMMQNSWVGWSQAHCGPLAYGA